MMTDPRRADQGPRGASRLFMPVIIAVFAAVTLYALYGAFLRPDGSCPAGPSPPPTPLHQAVKDRNLAEAVRLLDRGDDPNACARVNDEDGVTPLHLAAQTGRIDLCEALISRGAHINARTSRGRTPFSIAAGRSREVMELLVKNHVRLDRKDYRPLFSAVEGRHYKTDTIEYLMQLGFDPNLVNDQGLTALSLRVRPFNSSADKDLDFIRVLLDHGARPDPRDREGATPLINAAIGNQTGAAELLIAHGADLEARNNKGDTPLFRAAMYGKTEMVTLLLGKGADPNARNQDGEMPLHSPSQHNELEVVELLLTHGADPNARDHHGHTPLHWTSYFDHPDMARLLVKYGAQVDAFRSDNGSTALAETVADKGNNIAMARALLDLGADVNAVDSRGRSVLDLALKRGAPKELIALLKSRGAKSAQDLDPGEVKTRGSERNYFFLNTKSPIHVAAAKGELDNVKELLAQRPEDVKAQDEKNQYTPLHWAAANGHVEVMQYLIEHGADISARDKNGTTPIHLAAENDQIEALKFLLDHGADVGARNDWQWTPLHYCAFHDAQDTARMLIAAGAEVDAVGPKNWTPLINCARSGSIAAADVLISAGANIEVRTKNGNRTPLIMALQYEKPQFAKFLLARGAQPLPPGYKVPPISGKGEAGPTAFLDDIKAAIAAGESVDKRDDKGRTWLYEAASDGDYQAAEFLISKGADPNAKAQNGKTPLHIAVIRKQLRLVGLLLKKGADPNLKDDDNKTPLDYARDLNQRSIIELLTKYGAR